MTKNQKKTKFDNFVIAFNELRLSKEEISITEAGNIVWFMKDVNKILSMWRFKKDNKQFFLGCSEDYIEGKIKMLEFELKELRKYLREWDKELRRK